MRPIDINETLNQIGLGNLFAISGGRVARIINPEGDICGVRLPINSARRVEVVLDWNDTYIVRRVRQINRGSNRGQEIVEVEHSGVYCDQVGELAYQASCWK